MPRSDRLSLIWSSRYSVQGFVAESDGAEQILSVGHVSHDLAKGADTVSGLETVIFLGHFFGEWRMMIVTGA